MPTWYSLMWYPPIRPWFKYIFLLLRHGLTFLFHIWIIFTSRDNTWTCSKLVQTSLTGYGYCNQTCFEKFHFKNVSKSASTFDLSLKQKKSAEVLELLISYEEKSWLWKEMIAYKEMIWKAFRANAKWKCTTSIWTEDSWMILKYRISATLQISSSRIKNLS